jgi:predicted nucleic acid-binding protein
MYVLDTNIVSELRKNRPHGGVLAWLRSVDDRHLNLSAVSFGEIQAGIERTRESDPAKAAEIEAWADQLAETWNVLPMDQSTFRLWAKLVHRRSDDLFEDAMIAATALIRGFKVATRNTKDFKHFGVEIVNPYAPL